MVLVNIGKYHESGAEGLPSDLKLWQLSFNTDVRNRLRTEK